MKEASKPGGFSIGTGTGAVGTACPPPNYGAVGAVPPQLSDGIPHFLQMFSFFVEKSQGMKKKWPKNTGEKTIFGGTLG